jgi:hypothetical protein
MAVTFRGGSSMRGRRVFNERAFTERFGLAISMLPETVQQGTTTRKGQEMVS